MFPHVDPKIAARIDISCDRALLDEIKNLIVGLRLICLAVHFWRSSRKLWINECEVPKALHIPRQLCF